MILFGRRSLEHVLKEYIAHYHAERNHQGLDNDNLILFPDERAGPQTGNITKSERLGGLLKFYDRPAASSFPRNRCPLASEHSSQGEALSSWVILTLQELPFPSTPEEIRTNVRLRFHAYPTATHPLATGWIF